MSLTIVLPCYNEALNIEKTIAGIYQWASTRSENVTVVAVNDGSTDNTATVLENLQQTYPTLEVLHHQENGGYGAAIITGCNAAKTDWICYMDSDGQFKPDALTAVLAAAEGQQFVTGYRVKRADPWPRLLDAKLYGLFVRVLLGIKKRDVNCGINLFTATLWPTIRPQCASGALFAAEMFTRATHAGIAYHEVPVQHYPCEHGEQTGAKPGVVMTMLKEVAELRRQLKATA